MKVDPTNAAYTYISDQNRSADSPYLHTLSDKDKACTYVPTTTLDSIMADKAANEKNFDLVLLNIVGYESFVIDGAKKSVFNGVGFPKAILCNFDYWSLWQVPR